MNPCKVCLNDTVRSQVDRMISEQVSDEGISKALASIGVEIGKSSILRHRQNHPPKNSVDDVQLDPDMKIPRPTTIEPTPPMGDEAARLLEEVRRQVDRSDIDITKDRLVRETLLGRILESQLAITATALDRYQQGDGRYPLDMVKGLATVGTLFEKTVLHSVAVEETKDMLFEREITRLESIAREEAKTRVLNHLKVTKKPDEEYLQPYDYSAFTPGYETFRFGGCHMKGTEFNARITAAWQEGIKLGKAMLTEVVSDET